MTFTVTINPAGDNALAGIAFKVHSYNSQKAVSNFQETAFIFFRDE